MEQQTAIVLEDDALSAMAMCALLEDYGFKAYSASNRESALEILERVAPDVLVADWNLNGSRASIEIAQLVRRLNPKARVMFVSGYPEEDIRQEVGSVAPCSVFQKPLHYESFFAQLLGA